MRLHQQFDLNIDVLDLKGFSEIHKAVNEMPALIEKLINSLSQKGYGVAKEGVSFTGLPKSITVVKEFTGPFVSQFSTKVKDDFNAVSKALGIDRLFE